MQERMHYPRRIGQRLLLAYSLLLLAVTWPGLASAEPALPILVYHQIRIADDGPADGDTVISLARFAAQMRHLHQQGYVTLGMDEVIRFMKEGRAPADKIVALHFDDGWDSARHALPVLDALGFKATFWIIAGTGIGAPHMTWETIGALAQNPRFDLFSHTMTHPWKARQTLPDWLAGAAPEKGVKQVYWELSESRQVLEARLGRAVPYLAWPRGLYNDTLIRLARQAGYEALLTIDDGLNHYGGDLLRIRRTLVDGRCDDGIFRTIVADGRYRACATDTTDIPSAP